jgi:hypothetical protein
MSPTAERIATFDNDGTLWAEQPEYFQFLFAFDRVKSISGHGDRFRLYVRQVASIPCPSFSSPLCHSDRPSQRGRCSQLSFH